MSNEKDKNRRFDENGESYIEDEKFLQKRCEMVDKLHRQDILQSEPVIQAMLHTPRQLFVPNHLHNAAYQDSPLPIGKHQTISAPHMHAMMCEYLEISPGMKVLEIGTGSGYHTALLSYLVGKDGIVFTIERIKDLAEMAQKVFRILHLQNIKMKITDGTKGWPEHAPYDRILVTAASPNIPEILIEQLSSKNGLICIPTGSQYGNQELLVGKKFKGNFQTIKKCDVRFVPLIGKYGFKP
ncbi:MAG: protein-L-isoaspartate(D-aspartate) O-methyltransferase [Promethearchaeota archaeon]